MDSRRGDDFRTFDAFDFGTEKDCSNGLGSKSRSVLFGRERRESGGGEAEEGEREVGDMTCVS